MPEPPKGNLLSPASSSRRGVPFFYDKSEAEFKADVYERYDELVTRQTALHLADELHQAYPFQPLQNYIRDHLSVGDHLKVADVGCSVGRLIGDIANANTSWDCYGIDLSYQMLRQATDFWVKGASLRPNLIRYGWGTPELAGYELTNLSFALAKGELLPFPDASLDVVINTFLIDRLPTPFAAFAEWARVLKPGGRLITASPLNFLQPEGWRTAHPPVKILSHLQQQGWSIENWTDPLPLEEPMDVRGNSVRWACVAFVADKPS
ncbi:class I SAM-dependent methyltransferase [Neolewinella aurantiaca]|uniref:class I SAM-dependent methyltransferase n=1 Tax=Neolewinella aurantiaca TaxID=2602767 RepID=UPI00164F5E00|nr:class I SAM-dependent methyltransferase [Neolewinella aurantiaca]